MNEHDLERLVNLLSYLKKHDDVEQELGKDAPRQYSSAVTDPVQRRLHEAAGYPALEGVTDPKKLQSQYSSRYSGDTSSDTSSDMPEIPDTSDDDTSDVPDRSQEEIWQRLGQVASEYGMDEDQLIEMIEQYTAPDKPKIDKPKDKDIVEPYKFYHSGGGETGKRGGHYDTLGDKPIESVTAPSSDQIHTVLRSDPKERISKSSESILLSLLDRLGI